MDTVAFYRDNSSSEATHKFIDAAYDVIDLEDYSDDPLEDGLDEKKLKTTVARLYGGAAMGEKMRDVYRGLYMMVVNASEDYPREGDDEKTSYYAEKLMFWTGYAAGCKTTTRRRQHKDRLDDVPLAVRMKRMANKKKIVKKL
jgi:hypothetical protein